MEVALAGGVMVDLATKQDTDAHHARLRALLARPQVRARRLPGFITTGAVITRAPIITLQHPPAGALWVVQWIRTQQADPITAVAAASMVGYIGASAAVQNQLASASAAGGDDANAFTNGLAVPSLTNLPDKVVVYTQEELFFAIIGTSANIGVSTKYGVIVGVLEVPNTPEALTWI